MAPPLRKKHMCFHCGDPATALISQIKGPARGKWICMKRECWNAYYVLVSNA